MGKMSDIAIETDELIAMGYPPEEARKIAMKQALARARANVNKENKKNNKDSKF